MEQLDWVQRQSEANRKLQALRKVIQTHLDRKMPFSDSAIAVTLAMIRKHHGDRAAEETARHFGLTRH
ncbi:MAG: hypothetical protein Kow00100_25330 [Geothermobacteraceae bacterium]